MMGEFLPLLLGAVVGVGIGLRHGRAFPAAILYGTILGAFAAWFNGELTDAPWLVLFDAAQATVAVAATIVLVRAARRYTTATAD
jgi:hypothetical protein